MKKLLFIATAFVLSSVAFSQNTKAEDLIKFPGLVHDFGKIKQGEPVTYDFQFTNIASKPVVVESATASCGCTTPKWPQAPVMMGKKELINVGYNAASLGAFTKTITVKLAGVENPVILTISGDVLSPEAYEAYVKDKGKNGKSGGK